MGHYLKSARGKFSAFRRKTTLGLLSGALCLGLSSQALSNPEGGAVVHGNVQINPGTNMQIQQLTERAIIDWNSFSIGAAESVRFLQPDQLSVILNRVTGADPSIILGQLSANGNVFLLNRNGILFGPGSTVNVGGLVASSLNLSNEDFLAGNYNFFADSASDLAAVVNQGTITIADGGFAVLTGPSVLQEGVILARSGKVVLASGEQATLNLDGRDLVHFAVGEQRTEGVVLLAPGMLSDTMSEVLGVNSARRADSLIRNPDGSVHLVNGSGTTVQAGTVVADGSPGQDAGSILLDSSDVTVIGNGSVTSASGVGLDSSGGEVLVLSTMDGLESTAGYTDVQAGSLLAATGGERGDGGFIEVSGDSLNLHGEIDLSITDGARGAFLLDPVVVTIVDGDNAPTFANPLSFNANTIIGDEWFDANMGNFAFTLQSSGDIIFDLSTAGTNPNFDNVIDFQSADLSLIAGNDGAGGGPGVIDLGTTGTRFFDLDSLTIQAPGEVRLGDANVDVDGFINISGDQLVDFQSSQVEISNGADLTVNSNTAVDFGSSQIHSVANNNTGAVFVNSLGTLDFGTSNIQIDDDNRTILADFRAGGNIDFGDSTIGIIHTFDSATINVISTGGNIDFGTADIFFDQGFGVDPTINIQAAGSISSQAADMTPTFANSLRFEGNTTIAGNGISLPDVNLGVFSRGTLTLDAGTGSINIGESTIDGIESIDINAQGDLTATTPTLQVRSSRSLDIDVGGSATFQNATINPVTSNNSTSFFSLDAGGDIDLGSSQINVDAQSETTVFRLSAGQDLILGSSNTNIEHDFLAPAVELLAVGDIDFGTADFRFNQGFGTSPTVTIQAGGTISSQAADMTGAFANDITLDGATTISANGISLTDANLQIPGFPSLTINAGTGSLDLGESTVNVAGDLDIDAQGDLLATTPTIQVSGNGFIDIDVDGTATFQNATINPVTSNNSTSFFTLDAGGNIELGSSQIKVDAQSETTAFRLSSGADLLLGSSNTDIQHDFLSPAVQLLAVGNIDFGTADFLFNQDNTGTPVVTLQAGGTIRSQAADMTPTFANMISLEGTTNITANGISLPDVNLVVTRGGGLTVNAGTGNLDIGESTIDSNDDIKIDGQGDLIATTPTIQVAGSGFIDIDVDGAATFQSATINPVTSNNSTSYLSLDAGGDIDLGSSQIKVDAQSETTLFRLASGGDLSLGSTAINLEHDFSTPEIELVALGDLNMGSSSLILNQNFGAGTLLTLQAEGTLNLDTTTVTVPNRIIVGSNTGVTANSSQLNAPDIEVYGISSGTPSALVPVNGDVSLDLSSAANIDLSVSAVGDITVDHTGPGTLTAERVGVEGVGTAGSQGALRSTSGSVRVTSDSIVRLGNGSNDQGDEAIIEALGTGQSATISASQILDNNDNNANRNLDVRATSVTLSATSLVGVRNTLGPLEIQGDGITVDLSASSGGQATVDIVGANTFLKAAGNQSDILIQEQGTSNQLRVIDNGGDGLISLGLLPSTSILYTDENGIDLDMLTVGMGQTLGLEAGSGDIQSNLSAGDNVNLDGDLLMVASGAVGSQGNPISVSGGRVAGNATGGEFHLTTGSDALDIVSVNVQDHLGNSQLTGDGVVANSDVRISLTGTTVTSLNQGADIRSNSGSVAIDLVNGMLVQNAGLIAGDAIVLKTPQGAGIFDGTSTTQEIAIRGNRLVIDSGEDAIISQATGNLSIVDQASVGGQTYTSTGAGGDLRVRTVTSDLALNTDLSVGGEAALVAGNSLTLNQGGVGSITLNGNLNSTGNLVILAGGNIAYTSGTLTAPAIGLGAGGTVGAGNPVSIDTASLSLNPLAGSVTSATTFTNVNQVSATGATVNQGTTPTPPTPPTPTPPTTPTTPDTIVVTVELNPTALPNEVLNEPEIFAQNQVELVESILKELTDVPSYSVDEDPSRPPLHITDDEFLKKKFRR